MITLGAVSAITQRLTTIRFVSLDNRHEFTHHLDRFSTTIVAINHRTLIDCLTHQAQMSPLISLETSRPVSSIVERPNQPGVSVTFGDSETQLVKSVVNAAGPGWTSLPFPDTRRQRRYEESLVAVAYGRRCRGRILTENGDQAMLHPVSTNGTGRTSWVNASGPGEIELIYSTYCRRSEVGKIDRNSRYHELKATLTQQQLIEIDKEGPIISGFFGLEPALTPPPASQIYYHGERGQYNAATVGDAIAPTVRLSQHLAAVIVSGGNSKDYFKRHTSRAFNHRLEWALTQARSRAVELGNAFEMFNVVKYLNPDSQANLLHDHRVPTHLIPLLLLRYPHLITTFANTALEYAKTFAK